jgi:hypothetical protein
VAVGALGRQAALPSEVIEAIMALLNDLDSDVRLAVVGALGRHPALPSEGLHRYLKPLYAILLGQSFEEHLSFWVADEMYIDMPEGFTKIRFEGQQDQFRDAIQEIQKDFGIPLRDAPRT